MRPVRLLGSDGQVAAVLTDPHVTTAEASFLYVDWPY